MTMTQTATLTASSRPTIRLTRLGTRRSPSRTLRMAVILNVIKLVKLFRLPRSWYEQLYGSIAGNTTLLLSKESSELSRVAEK